MTVRINGEEMFSALHYVDLAARRWYALRKMKNACATNTGAVI
jgi:hypothetical protein